nr:hypothetical protein BaRGS_019782 [Batillaria attramentaria]
MEALSNKVNDLQTHTEAAQKLLADLSTQNTALETKLNLCETQNHALEQTVDEQNSTMVVMASEIVSLQNVMSVFQNTQASTTGQLTAATQNISTVSGKMTELDRLTSQLEVMTQSFVATGADLTSEITQMKAKDEKIENHVTRLEESEGSIARNSSEMGARITQVESKLQSATQRVSFFARYSHDSPTIRSDAPILVLDETLLNYGGGYSNSTGQFTAPVAGDYVLSAASRPPSRESGSPRFQVMASLE